MPFIAICPHCRDCRLRAPRAKRGKEVRCPKCSEVFPLVPEDNDDTSDDQSTSVEKKNPTNVSAAPSTNPEQQSEGRVPLAQIALGVAAIVILLSQLPYGRPTALLLAVLGTFAAGFATLELNKQRIALGLSGLILNGLLAAILTAYPATLGLNGWWETRNGTTQENAENPQGEWIDAGDAAWQQGGVRVGITFATVGGEPSSANASGTKERYLWIGVKITNVGAGNDLEFLGWKNLGSDGPAMTTMDGSLVAARQFVGASGKTVIQLGKFLECMIAFEIPPPGQDLLLSLPTQVFGDTATIHFRIPHVLVGRQ